LLTAPTLGAASGLDIAAASAITFTAATTVVMVPRLNSIRKPKYHCRYNCKNVAIHQGFSAKAVTERSYLRQHDIENEQSRRRMLSWAKSNVNDVLIFNAGARDVVRRRATGMN
jgi:hypothetical protein